MQISAYENSEKSAKSHENLSAKIDGCYHVVACGGADTNHCIVSMLSRSVLSRKRNEQTDVYSPSSWPAASKLLKGPVPPMES
uniref:Uncharacterized protein n=1 Tax=Ascaris lumbricoides TaxID=6252 RepID=A0A0M3I9S0_ASCLU